MTDRPFPKPLFQPEQLRVCTRTVMDNTDPDIRFDPEGVSNWWGDFHDLMALRPPADERRRQLESTIDEIKRAGHGQDFDCLLGLSGGVDSSYMAHLTKEWGLRPLVLHFDNGWNDELAVANIEAIVKTLDYRLNTFVMNWPEMRDLQRAYFKASVVDLDVPTDHMIFGALHKIADQHNIKYILSGNNSATEWVLPRAWYYPKFDLVNLVNIHRKFGDHSLKYLPKLGAWQRLYYQRVKKIIDIRILELIEYSKDKAKSLLIDGFGWKDYGGKHYESIFTRFYQGYILPNKFGIDKRKAHLSNLILNGEISRDQALAELSLPTDDPDRQMADKRYVAKKLGWSADEFDQVLRLPPRRHEEYGTEELQRRLADLTIKVLQPVAEPARRVLGLGRARR